VEQSASLPDSRSAGQNIPDRLLSKRSLSCSQQHATGSYSEPSFCSGFPNGLFSSWPSLTLVSMSSLPRACCMLHPWHAARCDAACVVKATSYELVAISSVWMPSLRTSRLLKIVPIVWPVNLVWRGYVSLCVTWLRHRGDSACWIGSTWLLNISEMFWIVLCFNASTPKCFRVYWPKPEGHRHL
jgi:hypothetical protein